MNTRPLRQRSVLGLLALSLAALSACAQPAPPSGNTPGSPTPGAQQRMGEHRERMQAWQARRLQELKAKLQLTAAQEGDWNRFASAVQTPPARGAHEQQHQEMMNLSTPERLDRMKALRAQHQGEMNAYMDRVSEATRSFYATLTPEQKKTFDAETARMMNGRGRHGGEGHMHGGPGMMQGGRP